MQILFPIFILLVLAAAAMLAALVLVRNVLYVCPPNQVLIFSGATPRTSADGKKISYRIIKGGRTLRIPLLEAVDRGDFQVARAMVESGAPVNQATEFGRAPLGAAIATNAGTDDGVRLVRLLLARGADPNRRLETGERPLTKAAAAGDRINRTRN